MTDLSNRSVDLAVIIGATSNQLSITPASSAAAESNHVFKAAPGALYSLYLQAITGSGYLVTINSASAPTSGSPIAPVDAVSVGVGAIAGIDFGPGPPDAYSLGITALFTASGSPFTYSTGSTGFFKARFA